jgi:hypothetical protein
LLDPEQRSLNNAKKLCFIRDFSNLSPDFGQN